MLIDRSISIDTNHKSISPLSLAKFFITLAVYCFIAAVLLEQFNPITVLKTLAILFSAHGFYFLFKHAKSI
ncbi:MAG: hypothetical protein HQL46_04990 [Gammaproteobacteria bacterium]|nr:hypothetical protein [Gammaproteobacteria bacterium]